MMKKYNLDWKVFAYSFLWTVVVRWFKNTLWDFGPESYIFFYGLGAVFIFIGLLVAVMERRLGFGFFYAWGKNWKGCAFGNSSAICGAAVGFLPLALAPILAVWLIVCTLIILVKNIVNVNEEHVNAEKHYPIR